VRLHKDAKVELIRKVPLFAACSKRELADIASLADELAVPEGRTLIEEGKRGREFIILVEGSVDVRRRGRTIRKLSDGDFFGEIALVSNAPRTATVTTTSPARLLVIVDRAFAGLLQRSPGIQKKVLETLALRIAPETV
jgi:CRP/FNR family transcriptional regulator, cyclic AMP receptor protein